MTKTLIDELPFEIDARIPLQLGRESISSSMVAISELVKNSYDAEATKVTLEFKNLGSTSPSLVIIDNGAGMNKSSFLNNWLRIGTTNKTKNIRSKKLQRVLTGAKGLGRLGVDRLSKKLILHTKTKDSNKAYELVVQWNKYEQDEISLSDVKHEFYECDIPITDENGDIFLNSTSEGTRLSLVDLKDNWDLSLLSQLRQQLAFLVSPFSQIGDFEIEIKSGHPSIDGRISSESILEAAAWKAEAKILESNEVIVTYEDCIRGKKYTSPSSTFREFIGSNENETTECGPLKFDLYYIPWDEPKHINKPSFNKKDIRLFMESNQGIRIYRDSFRVRPYGEPDSSGDWLNLSSRAVRSPGGIAQGGWRVGPHQVIGAVQIGRTENPKLSDQTNREGIVESKAFFDLRKFAISVIEGFEHHAHSAAKTEKDKLKTKIEKSEEKVAEASEKSKSTISNLKSRIQLLSSSDSNNEEWEKNVSDQMVDLYTQIEKLEEEIRDVEIANQQSKKAYEEKSKELESEKNTLANLASLGILSVAFGHETTQYAISAAGNALVLKKSFQEGKILLGPDQEEIFVNAIDIIIRNTSFIKNFSKFYLSSVRPTRRKRKHIVISNVLDRTIKALNPSLERQNINIKTNTNDCQGIKVVAFEIDIESMFVNLIANSIYAMSKTPKDHRLIEVTFSKTNDTLIINFSDSGAGIPKIHLKSIFEPMFSTKKDNKGNQEGTGMGLTITKTIVEDHIKGSIEARSSGRLKGAEFVLNLPIKK